MPQLHPRFGQLAYMAYSASAGGKSLATGDPLPKWEDLPQEVKDAWLAAAGAVMSGSIPLQKGSVVR